MATLRIAASFADDMEQVYSERIEERIYAALEGLREFPELGAVDSRAYIRARFGGKVRKLVIGPFDLFYRYDSERDEVRVVALMNQRTIM